MAADLVGHTVPPDTGDATTDTPTLDPRLTPPEVDVVVEMAATGQTGMGFPEEYGGGGDIGASVAAFETLAVDAFGIPSEMLRSPELLG